MTNTIPHTIKSLHNQGRYRSLNLPRGIDLASNDYLGFRDHPQIRAAALNLIEQGISLGSGGSRLLRGHHKDHAQLEEKASSFFESPRSLFMANGYQANHALFSCLPSRHDIIIFDSLIHASARESIHNNPAKNIKIPHNNLNAYEDALKKYSGKTTYLAIESLYSMDGDFAPIKELYELTQKYGATLIIDEAHSTGVYGTDGRGLSESIAKKNNHQGLITLHTCGKALGLSGGIIGAESDIIDYLINKARPFIYSTAPAPFAAALISAALDLCASSIGDQARTHLADLCSFAKEKIGGHGSAIIPIILGTDEAANKAAAHLQECGYDIRAVRPPTVPEGSARLRLSLNAKLDKVTLDTIFKNIPS